MKILLKNYKLILRHGIGEGLDLVISNGYIEQIGHNISANDYAILNGEGKYLSPGFIDIHVHGGAGFDFADVDADEYVNIAEFHAHHGTTALYPTLIGGDIQLLREADKAFIAAQKKTLVQLLGIHIEGPFINPVQAGAISLNDISKIDENYYKKIFSECKTLKRMTYAPELEGSENLLQYMTKHGLIASAGHTDAKYDDILKAFQKGCRLLTHFYSAMSSVRRINAYRMAGAVEAGYLLDDMFVEVIADGSHLPIELLQMICKIKQLNRIILITDAMRGAGQPDGPIILGNRKNGVPALIEEGVAKLPDRSAFAGSVATMDRLIRVMRANTNFRLYEIIQMATYNPALIMGVEKYMGSLEEGKLANLIVFDENINVTKVFVQGEIL